MFFVVFSIRLIVKASFRGYNGTNRSGCSRRDWYLGMTAAIPQVPVPTAIDGLFYWNIANDESTLYITLYEVEGGGDDVKWLEG